MATNIYYLSCGPDLQSPLNKIPKCIRFSYLNVFVLSTKTAWVKKSILLRLAELHCHGCSNKHVVNFREQSWSCFKKTNRKWTVMSCLKVQCFVQPCMQPWTDYKIMSWWVQTYKIEERDCKEKQNMRLCTCDLRRVYVQ